MARSKRENVLKWMEELAEFYDISLETIEGVYNGLVGKWNGMPKEDRTRMFFKLYFEGVRNE